MTGASDRDGSDWTADLLRKLKDRRRMYDDVPSLEARRHQAALMIGDIVQALQTIPEIADSDLYPLKDTLMMFNDLESGRAHPWSIPTNFGGTNRHTSADMEVRIWVAMAQQVLIQAGHSGKATDRIVKEHLGATGRQLSLSALEKWRKAYSDGQEPRLRHVERLLAEHWAPIVCEHGSDPLRCGSHRQAPCAHGKRLAEDFAAWAIRTPTFADRTPSPHRK